MGGGGAARVAGGTSAIDEWHHHDDERLIVRVLVRGLLHLARDEIESAEASVRRSRLEDEPQGSGSIRPLRIAIRRIEYQLATMGDVDSSLEVAALVDQLHEVGKPFGQLRDMEIISARVAKLLGDRADTHEVERLLETAADEKYRAQIASDVALDSGALRDAVAALNEFRKALPSDAVTAVMARPVAQQAIRVTWRSVKRAAATAKADGSDDSLHALRRSIKRAVYSTRGFSYVLGPSAEEFAARLVALQKVIGRQHDHVIVAEWLHQVGEDHASLKPLAHRASSEERRKAENGSTQWMRPWKEVRELHPKKTVMTTYSFFD